MKILSIQKHKTHVFLALLSISALLLQGVESLSTPQQPTVSHEDDTTTPFPFPKSFGSAGLGGSTPAQLGTPTNDGTTPSDNSIQESQPGYQQQQQLGGPQTGTNLPFSANSNNNNKQFPRNFNNQLPFGVSNQNGVNNNNPNHDFNGAPGKSSLVSVLSVSLVMFLVINFVVLS